MLNIKHSVNNISYMNIKPTTYWSNLYFMKENYTFFQDKVPWKLYFSKADQKKNLYEVFYKLTFELYFCCHWYLLIWGRVTCSQASLKPTRQLKLTLNSWFSYLHLLCAGVHHVWECRCAPRLKVQMCATSESAGVHHVWECRCTPVHQHVWACRYAPPCLEHQPSECQAHSWILTSVSRAAVL